MIGTGGLCARDGMIMESQTELGGIDGMTLGTGDGAMVGVTLS
jgi:hypothetical protein